MGAPDRLCSRTYSLDQAAFAGERKREHIQSGADVRHGPLATGGWQTVCVEARRGDASPSPAARYRGSPDILSVRNVTE